jgi:hypothetical protein
VRLRHKGVSTDFVGFFGGLCLRFDADQQRHSFGISSFRAPAASSHIYLWTRVEYPYLMAEVRWLLRRHLTLRADKRRDAAEFVEDLRAAESHACYHRMVGLYLGLIRNRLVLCY